MNHRQFTFLLLFWFAAFPFIMNGQSELNSTELIKSSIAYHDPSGILESTKWKMSFEDSRPDGTMRKASFLFDPISYDFEMVRSDENTISLAMTNGQFSATLNGSENITTEDIKTYRITEERAVMMRNYYHYLWCMPMKLNDPGTIVHEEVQTKDFFGKTSLEVKVTYEAEVGDDIWYFYFNPTTYALQGYRFYHDESANDGEYILLDGELEAFGVRIPQTRKWYMHQDDKYLGQDKLVKLEKF